MAFDPSKDMVLYEMQADICHALSHPIRLYILDLIADDELSSSQLLEELGIPKANLSQHLSVLKEAGILKTRKVGSFQMISLAIPKIKEACRLVQGILSDRLAENQLSFGKLKKKLDSQTKITKKVKVKKTIKGAK